MATFDTNGISLYYETFGNPANPPVMLITGLGGIGKSWNSQVPHFAKDFYVVVPDHRGTGRSTHTLEGHTTQQLAADMASLIEHLACGPMHVVGASTGGAIAQYMALSHPHTVRSLTLSSTFARFDTFTQIEFKIRRKMVSEWDRRSVVEGSSLFLFSPRYIRENPKKLESWIEQAAAHSTQPEDLEIALKRIDMVASHDALARLGEIRQPTLVVCGNRNFCTPLPLSEEIAHAVPGAELVIFEDAGELIEIEQEEKYFQVVSDFIKRHG